MIQIQKLKKYNGSMTVGELIEKLENEQKEDREAKERSIKRVKEKFKSVYLKRTDNCPLFGETLEIYFIEDIVDTSITTNWELIYYIKGKKIQFSKRDISFRDISETMVSDTFSEKELNQMTRITKEEYDQYSNEYEQIKYMLKSLISGHYGK